MVAAPAKHQRSDRVFFYRVEGRRRRRRRMRFVHPTYREQFVSDVFAVLPPVRRPFFDLMLNAPRDALT